MQIYSYVKKSRVPDLIHRYVCMPKDRFRKKYIVLYFVLHEYYTLKYLSIELKVKKQK